MEKVTGNPDYVVQMYGITKKFSGIKALDHVDFFLEPGKINCLCGENGAGKSTLIKILSGAYQCDEGTIFIGGEQVKIASPKTAKAMGINPIYQELDLVDCMSIAENIYLGNEIKKNAVLIDRKKMIQEAEALMEELGIELDVRKNVGQLSVALKQMVAIAKALSIQSKVLILDEPSDVLTGRELEVLFETIGKIKAKGVGIVYISHRLEEIFEIGDVITILRDGMMIDVMQVRDTTRKELIQKMVGHEVDENITPQYGDPSKPMALEVEDLNRGTVLNHISFCLRSGEILGVAGLVGAGRTELARAVIGADPIDSGTIRVFGKEARVDSPARACEYGIGYIPEDRKNDGLVLIQSVGNNVILTVLDRLSRLGLLQRKKINSTIEEFIKQLSIKCSGPAQQAKNLSGGNQQKIVVAKWLATGAKILILDEPTRGIDVGAKTEIYNIIRDFAKQGHAIMMISSEMSEILNISDRIMVMSEGSITKNFDSNQVSQEELLEYALPRSLRKGDGANDK